MSEPSKFFVKSYGCQMNVYDSQRMADTLVPQGFVATDAADAADAADVVVLNTCHIREKAAEKVYSELGRVRRLKEAAASEGRRMIVAVAGCVAQAEGEEILKRAGVVDIVVGPQSYQHLPDLIARARAGQRVVDTEFPVEDKFDELPDASETAIRARGVSAFVTIQEGCDRFCTFCVVPYTRGAEVSRPVQDIVAEVTKLVRAGVREVSLLGQNVNAYHGEGADGGAVSLAGLLRRLADLPGLARLRYTTSHPLDMSDDLIRAHGDLPQLMPYLHLPVQSGSDRILQAMNRKHDRAFYFDVVEKIRSIRPDLALSSDFIVGFPGETDADFADTMDLIEKVGFAGAFSFKYSRRPGTPGADLPDQVPEAVKNDRLQALQALLTRQQQAFNVSLVGHTFEVLFEKEGRYRGQIAGRSPWLQPVLVMGDENLIGSCAPVRILESLPNSLKGELISADLPGKTDARPEARLSARSA